ncbi:hypothetical protein [Streptomyces sp. NPDC093109]|uniref:hypothetical protein n=1 Tax=Streptomyces sp. NPDC093109 TaxID=3154977 RepID=UPI00344C959F
MPLSSIPVPLLIVVALLSAAAFVGLWAPLMATREQKVMIGLAALAVFAGLGAFGGAKAGWSFRQILLYAAVIALSFAVGALGHRERIRQVARREADEGPSKENQMPGLLMLQLFGTMGALFYLTGKLFET